MVSKQELGDKIFRWLVEIDEETSRRVAANGCPLCGGPLHRGDFPRKPRGELLALCGEVFTRRISLCCGRQGCRRRATPPSVRYLGRRVYLGVAVVLASALLFAAPVKEVRRATEIPSRTLKRWSAYWQFDFPESRLFEEQRGLFVPPLCTATLPASLMARFEQVGRDDVEVLVRTLCFLSPMTTGSICDGARFLRVE